ncbi:MAG: ATP-binding cassette domain-containing protein [Paludibacter sp.]|nr:ATP-binding cassette domain-containing protein [Paludibacter sp.]
MFKLENITKTFTKQFVLQNFSYEILKGDKVIISGKSGIGKTTLFRLLLGFETVDSGNIFFEDQLLNEQTVWELRKKVAYVSQDLNIGRGKVQSLFDETLSLKSNIQYKNSSNDKINDLFIQFNLDKSLLDKDVEELSGGEKQRIAIINALLLNRDIFFLDEITSALDKTLKFKVMDFFFENPSYTVLSVSHDNYLPQNTEIKIINLDKV